MSELLFGKPIVLNRYQLAIEIEENPTKITHYVQAGKLQPDLYDLGARPLFLKSRTSQIKQILTEPQA